MRVKVRVLKPVILGLLPRKTGDIVEVWSEESVQLLIKSKHVGLIKEKSEAKDAIEDDQKNEKAKKTNKKKQLAEAKP